MSKAYLIECNKEGNQGRVKINIYNVTHYEQAEDKPNGATRIFLVSGKEIIVADTVEQIDVLLDWKKDGKLDFAGNHVQTQERRRGTIEKM